MCTEKLVILLLKAVNFELNLVEKKNFIIKFVYILTILVIIFVLLKFLILYLFPFIIGFIIAYIVQKPAQYLARKSRFKKQTIAAILSVLTYIFIALILFAFIWCLVINTNRFIVYITSLSNSFENFLAKTNQFINKLCSKFGGNFQSVFEQAIDGYIGSFTTKAINLLSSGVTKIIKNLPIIFLTTIITIVSSCFFAKDFDKFIKFFKGIMSDNIFKNILMIKDIFLNSVVKLLIGYAKIMIITFIELLIGLLVLGVDHYLILALLISVIDLLPIIGTGTILLPWAVISFLQSNFKMGVGIIVLYIIICTVRNFLEPKIIGEQMGINPLLTLITMFLGLKILGVFGVISFPVAFIVIFTFYRNKFA